MPDTLTCREVDERSLVERYVAGRLTDEAELAEFEAHFVSCPDCQEEVRLGMTVRQALAARPRAAVSKRRVLIPVGAGLAAAAAVAVFLLARAGPSGTELRRLGGVVEPPVYLGVPVRATPRPADSVFERAMAEYAERRYDAAVVGLDAALAAGVDAAPTEFFRASSLLMLDRARDAAQAYRRVIALGETPYLPEARYYLAKALVRLGRASEALSELQSAAAGGGELGAQARAFADSVEGLLTR